MKHELNNRQHHAVITSKDKVLVMAGAGTGKTIVLTSRIKFLIDAGVPEETILAFTFTNKAANPMKWRLERMLGRETFATMSTFHSYCFGYVMMHYEKLGFRDTPVIIDDDDKSKIVKNILLSIEEDYSNIEFIKNIAKVKNHAPISSKFTDREQLIFNTVYHQYQKELLESNRVDFDDMIPLFIKLLKVDEDLKEDIIAYAYFDEMSASQVIRRAVKEFLIAE